MVSKAASALNWRKLKDRGVQNQQLSCDGEDSSGQRRPRNPPQDEVTSCPLVQWPWDILSLSRQIASSEPSQFQTVGGGRRDVKIESGLEGGRAGPGFPSLLPSDGSQPL